MGRTRSSNNQQLRGWKEGFEPSPFKGCAMSAGAKKPPVTALTRRIPPRFPPRFMWHLHQRHVVSDPCTSAFYLSLAFLFPAVLVS